MPKNSHEKGIATIVGLLVIAGLVVVLAISAKYLPNKTSTQAVTVAERQVQIEEPPAAKLVSAIRSYFSPTVESPSSATTPASPSAEYQEQSVSKPATSMPPSIAINNSNVPHESVIDVLRAQKGITTSPPSVQLVTPPGVNGSTVVQPGSPAVTLPGNTSGGGTTTTVSNNLPSFVDSKKSSYYLVPNTGTIHRGCIFSVDVYANEVNLTGTPVGDIILKYNPQQLSGSSAGNNVNFDNSRGWVTHSFYNVKGKIFSVAFNVSNDAPSQVGLSFDFDPASPASLDDSNLLGEDVIYQSEVRDQLQTVYGGSYEVDSKSCS